MIHQQTTAERPAAPPTSAERPNSMNSALIIHRVGPLNPDFADEARAFSAELTRYMNEKLDHRISTMLLDEPLAETPRLHWLVHLRAPEDYRLLLNMVDYDATFRDIYNNDRLPQRGGGNWERMFVQGGFHETVLLPQHGFARHQLDRLDADAFIPPAWHQIEGGAKDRLHSQNAGAILLRGFHALYESRDLARYYLHEWQSAVHRSHADLLTCGQYEQIWGHQDRLNLMIHLRSLDDYDRLREAEANHPDIAAVNARPRVTLDGLDKTWNSLFEAGSPYDILLRPITID